MNAFRATVESLPLGPSVEVLEVSEQGLVALNKPPVVLSHPNSNEDIVRSLLKASYDLEEECYTWEADGETHKAWLLHRLDSPTSGVILIALDHKLAGEIKELFATQKARKTYHAIVKGNPNPPAQVWNDRLNKSVRKGKVRVKLGTQTSASTECRVVKCEPGGFPVALVKLNPLTGRTHQLRVQCRKRGHPIVGDKTYGSFSLNRTVKTDSGVSRMLLHSSSIELHYPHGGKIYDFVASAPLPDAFREVLAYRDGLYGELMKRQKTTGAKLRRSRPGFHGPGR